MNWFLFAAFSVGVMLSAQAAVNARLGKDLGHPELGAFVSLAMSALLMLLYCLVVRPSLPARTTLNHIPAWAWLGGVFGAVNLMGTIIIAPKIGLAPLSGLIITGLLIASVIFDHFGFFGVAQHPVVLGRVVGVLFLLVGIFSSSDSKRRRLTAG